MVNLRIETVVLLAVTLFGVEAKLNSYIPPYKNPSPCAQSYDYGQLYPSAPLTVEPPCVQSPSIPCPARSTECKAQDTPRSYPYGVPTPPLPTIPFGYEPWPVTYLNTNYQYTPSPSTCRGAQPSTVPYPAPCKTPCRLSLNPQLAPPLRTKFQSNVCHNLIPPRTSLCKFMPLLLSPLLPPAVPHCAVPPPMPGSCQSGCSSSCWSSHDHL